jgi:hypothetical protein
MSAIALRVHIRTVFEGSIYTITEVLKLLPALLHSVFEHKPPTLNLVEVWRISRQIPDFATSLRNHVFNGLGMSLGFIAFTVPVSFFCGSSQSCVRHD